VSQSVSTLRQVRLTTSLLTAPPNQAASARLTRRVLVPQVGARDQRLDLARHPRIPGRSGAASLLRAPPSAVIGAIAQRSRGVMSAKLTGGTLSATGPNQPSSWRLRTPFQCSARPPSARSCRVRPAQPFHALSREPFGCFAQRRRQLLLQQLLDDLAHPTPEARLDRVKPGLPCKQRRAVRLCLCVVPFHGVVCAGA